MKVAWYGTSVASATTSAMGTRLRVIAIAVMRHMQTHMTPRPPGKGARKHVPSRPGQPPAVRTGRLRSSILWELDDGSNSQNGGRGERATRARIGVPPHTIYGLYLELGVPKRGLAPRPWMRPALDAVTTNLRGLMEAS